jgi:hypothetical protein
LVRLWILSCVTRRFTSLEGLVALSTSENTVGSTVTVHESAEKGGRSATTSNFVIELPRIKFLANEKWLISDIF